MPLVVQTVTPPAVEPVLLAEAKLHLKVDADDDDALISSFIVAARRLCAVKAKAEFVNTVFQLVDDAFPFTGGYLNRQVRQFYGNFAGGTGMVYPGVLALNSGSMTLPRGPVVSVQSIRYLDANGVLQTMDPSTYVVVPGNPGRVGIAYGQVWPVTYPEIGAVTIEFTAGYGPDNTTAPENVKTAMKLLIGNWYTNRNSVIVGATTSVLDQAVDALLGVENTGGGYC